MGTRHVAPRTKFPFGFSGTMERVHYYDSQGFTRAQIGELLGITKSVMSKGVRIYLTSIGKTPDSGYIDIKNKALELTKRLDADDISLHNADVELVAYIRQVTGRGTTYRKSASAVNPEQQLSSYNRIIGQLEGMCYGLDKMPEVVHSSITKSQRNELERRLADCRRIIERRINIIRKDENAEAGNQEG